MSFFSWDNVDVGKRTKKNYKLQSSNDSKKGKTKNGKLNVFHCEREIHELLY